MTDLKGDTINAGNYFASWLVGIYYPIYCLWCWSRHAHLRELVIMIKDIQQIRNLLKEADQFIIAHPEILETSVDEIFHKLDDGTDKMRSLRWGVMTRAKLCKLDVDKCDIIDYLSGISCGVLLCEYIGFVLQQEYGIDLLDLLLKANKKGKVNEIVPFIAEILVYEDNCHIEDIDEIIKNIKNVENDVNRNRLIHSYAELIVKKGEENRVYNKFMKTADDSIGQLILEMRIPLRAKESEKYKQWEKAFVVDKREQLNSIGIQYIRLSYTLSEDIDQYFHLLQKYRTNDDVMVLLIPIYIEYLEENTGSNLNSIATDIIQCIKEKRKAVIDSLINNLYLADESCEKVEEILEILFHIDLDSIVELLNRSDYSLAQIYESRPEKLFRLICSAYVVNQISWTRSIWRKLSNVTMVLQNHGQDIIGGWVDLIDGTTYEYFFALSCVGTIIDINLIYKRISESKWPEKRVLRFLEGCCLFMIHESDNIELLFLFADYIENQEEYSEFCYENAYLNYPGKTITVAGRYLHSEDIKKKELSKRLIENDNRMKDRVQAGRGIKDFMPSTYRLQIYHKFKQDEFKSINKMVKDDSILLDLFQPRTMKYGNKIAFVQRDNDNCFFRVSPVITSTYSIEVPARELIYPLEMIQKRKEFLERRGNITDEVDS